LTYFCALLLASVLVVICSAYLSLLATITIKLDHLFRNVFLCLGRIVSIVHVIACPRLRDLSGHRARQEAESKRILVTVRANGDSVYVNGEVGIQNGDGVDV